MCIYSFEGFYGTCSNEIEKKNQRYKTTTITMFFLPIV